MIDLEKLRDFNATKFEESLSKEDGQKFLPYIMEYHTIKKQYERLCKSLNITGVDEYEQMAEPKQKGREIPIQDFISDRHNAVILHLENGKEGVMGNFNDLVNLINSQQQKLEENKKTIENLQGQLKELSPKEIEPIKKIPDIENATQS